MNYNLLIEFKEKLDNAIFELSFTTISGAEESDISVFLENLENLLKSEPDEFDYELHLINECKKVLSAEDQPHLKRDVEFVCCLDSISSYLGRKIALMEMED